MKLVLDWDGTVTERDTLNDVVVRHGDPEVFHRTEEELGRRLTLHEVIAVEVATIRASLDEVTAWLVEHARVRPGFRELAEARRPLIVSSGFHELIEPVLEREGVAGLEVRANRLEPRADGWRALWRDGRVCKACGEPCKRGSLPTGEIVYVGDGYSDRCAALAAGRVFATAGLADFLRGQGVPFEPFADFHGLARALAA